MKKKSLILAIDDLDNLTTDGCNPIGVEDRTDKDGKKLLEQNN